RPGPRGLSRRARPAGVHRAAARLCAARESKAMIALFLCSVFTIFPDFLCRRYGQGKKIGTDITLYSVWFDLRYGITACLFLTILLLTVILYFHPSTSNVISFYRTVPILPEGS